MLERVNLAHVGCSRRGSTVRGAGTASCTGRGECHLLTEAIVQEVSDEAGAAGGPGLLGIHVSHHRGHDVAGGALRPIQTSALLRVVMEHAEDMACGAEALLVATNPIPGPSVGCRPIKAWLQLWRIRSIPNLLLPPVSFWCSKGFSVCSPHFSVSLPPDIFRGPP